MIHHHHAQTLPAGQIRMPGKLLESIGGSVLASAEGLEILFVLFVGGGTEESSNGKWHER
jgi:hypothetical protein